MKEKRKYKWFSIEKITGERWHIGAFIASDDFNQFYLMIALVKWDIYIGKIVDGKFTPAFMITYDAGEYV